ncbi:hypothetical protein D5S17_10050 [Pseudonocardiaceae bacterium YIM PH 21723]|nr:hypothetical protein D5S17_10050 [Pseudonocardiaceae bacterium YIM PH 21723]
MTATVDPVLAPEESTVEPARRFLTLPWLIAVTVALVGSLTAAVLFGIGYQSRSSVESASNSALATARSYAVTVTSYDYQHLDQNFADVLGGATGNFKNQYGGASSALKELIVAAKSTAKGSVAEAAVKSASTDRVSVLLFVDQVVTNEATKDQPRIDKNRVSMTLEKVGDRWLVSELELA